MRRNLFIAIVLLISVVVPQVAAEKIPDYCPLPKNVKIKGTTDVKMSGVWTGEWMPAHHRFCMFIYSIDSRKHEVEAIYSWDLYSSDTPAGWKKVITKNYEDSSLIFEWGISDGGLITIKMDFQQGSASFERTGRKVINKSAITKVK